MMFIHRRSTFLVVMLALLLLLGVALSHAQIAATNKISDVRGTKHNFSKAGDGTTTPSGGIVPVRVVKSTTEDQVCVFCHTPHAATTGLVAPLWNRALSTQTYTPLYSSNSMESDPAQPGGSSKLCLSCHDGSLGIDKVNVLNGASNATIPMTNTGGVANTTPVKMPTTNATTGFTRNLGTDLSNDHPISFTYNGTLATADGELRTPEDDNTTGGIVMNRLVGKAKPVMPLEGGQLQCTTCHDPHLRDQTTTNGNAKFLRVNRFQVGQPIGGTFDKGNDIICLACHDKGGQSWAYSAHANSQVATQTYKSAAANTREFPLNGVNGPPVWQVACLNCHDTHTVQGARKLLREGASVGAPAQEETCYQCHQSSAGSVVNYTALAANAVPDIKTDFTLLARRMPIALVTEVHDIGGVFNDATDANCSKTVGKCGKDLLESRDKLGVASLNNRHAECSDCHNPHRVIKGQNGLPGSLTPANTNEKAGTHKHENAAGYTHSNIISGVLRGSWGVEPVYPDNSFQSLPTATSFVVKRGDPGNAGPIVTSRPGAETYVTREYQICMKCHSNYAYPDDNLYPNSTNRPQLGVPGTPSNSNGHLNFTSYTNQAKEFQAPSTHAVTVGSVSKGNEGGTGTAGSNSNNHRSWHPVMAPTGRLGRAGSFLSPWNNNNDANGVAGTAGRLGNQTMMCSDCHGSATDVRTVIPAGNTVGTTAISENGSPWGPHGSANNFILKGTWDTGSGEGDNNTLCFKCHNQSSYSGSGGGTGFTALKADGSNQGDGHALHSNRIDTAMKCNFCHVAVPHGWKNRGLLVNLRDVGKEAGQTAGTDVGNGPYTNGPYYRKAFLRISSFPTNGQWNESMCGGRDNMRSACEAPN